eukprot:4705304-Amphidinium_carterae.1
MPSFLLIAPMLIPICVDLSGEWAISHQCLWKTRSLLEDAYPLGATDSRDCFVRQWHAWIGSSAC